MRSVRYLILEFSFIIFDFILFAAARTQSKKQKTGRHKERKRERLENGPLNLSGLEATIETDSALKIPSEQEAKSNGNLTPNGKHYFAKKTQIGKNYF